MGKNRRVIRRFHTLLKHKATASKHDDLEKVSKIDSEMKKLGGVAGYQAASEFGKKAGGIDCSRWVLPSLSAGDRVLDIGALADYFSDQRDVMDITAIDLNPCAENVVKGDFFEMDFPESFDAVVLSLVVNFVDDPIKRGEMLKKAVAITRREGLIFIVLPLMCIQNSRYLKHGRFVKLVKSLGAQFESVSNTNKLARYVFKRNTEAQDKSCQQVDYPRKTCRFGKGSYNNFTIVTRHK